MFMKRTTIMADESELEKLRQIARQEGLSLGEIIRQAMAMRASQRRPRPKFIASGASKKGPHDTARRSSDMRFEPRSWR